MSLVTVDEFDIVGKNKLNWWRCFPSNFQKYLCTQASVPCFILFKIRSNSSHWDFCFYRSAALKNAGWTRDIVCKVLVQFVFCRLSWRWKVQFPQVVSQTADAWTTKVPSQFLRFLHDICSFSSRHVPTRRNYWNSRCSVLSILKITCNNLSFSMYICRF